MFFNNVEWFTPILIIIVFLFQRHHPEDGHVSGRIMLVTILQ